MTRSPRWVALGLVLPGAWAIEPVGAASPPDVWEPWRDPGFSYRLQGLGYGIVRDPVADSTLNPDNFLNISRYQATAELRLDLELARERLTLGINPRLELTWQEWDTGPRDGTSQTDEDLFVNGWLVRYRFGDRLFAAYTRENLQWGPSFLLSPSNPFIERNGKNNPWLEMPGLARFSFARSIATWEMS